MEKAYKFRIYPNAEQVVLIHRTFGCCRFVFNHFLSQRIHAYSDYGKTLNYNACSAELTVLKTDGEHGWLREADATALQSSLKDLEAAYQNFFRNIKKGGAPGFPKFKSKRNRHKSYNAKRVGENIAVLEKHVKLPKLGLVRAAISKKVVGRILNATVSQAPSGKYFVSLCCTDVFIKPLAKTGAAVGVDVGLKSLVATSDENTYPNHKYIRQSEKKLAKAQRELSRKQKGSRNREKARVKVARVQERIANQRTDALHKLTTDLVRNYDVICAEDLHVKGMVHNHKLAKAINDASWGELCKQLRYKCEWYGKTYVEVDRFYPSSQLCSHCNDGVKYPLDLSVRDWVCPNCGTHHDRDINAAKNIKNEGLRILAQATVGRDTPKPNAWGDYVRPRRVQATVGEPRIPLL